MKRRRRIPVGDLVTIVFENTDTMRWQVQEMARAERMLTDDAIADQVATYNELIPNEGELSGTLFIELTDDAKLREWLPKLVNIQHDVRFDLADGSHVDAVPEDEERLTRDDVTATVHYLKFPFTPAQRELLAVGSCPHRDRPSRLPRGRRAHRRAARRAWLATSRSERVQVRVHAPRSGSAAARASSTPTTPGSTSTHAKT